MLPGVDSLVCDANILIDFYDVDTELISTICREVINLYVPVPVLAEVDQLDMDAAINLGLVIEDTPLEYLNKEKRLPGCSKQDSACFHLAHDKGWGCATNEKKLKKHCEDAGIPVVRGLRLILASVEKGVLSRKKAEQIASGIVSANGWIEKRIMPQFLQELEDIQE